MCVPKELKEKVLDLDTVDLCKLYKFILNELKRRAELAKEGKSHKEPPPTVNTIKE